MLPLGIGQQRVAPTRLGAGGACVEHDVSVRRPTKAQRTARRPDTHKAKRVTEERDGASEDARLKRQKIGIWLKTFCCEV